MNTYLSLLPTLILGIVGTCFAESPPVVPIKIEVSTAFLGTDTWDWWQVRTAYVPGPQPRWITTMSETGKTGTHNFHDIYQSISSDAGKSWSSPEPIPSLKRTKMNDGYEIAPGDLWPAWHAKSGKVLTTGKTFNFANGTKENFLREKVSYSVMDPATNHWGPMRFLEMPEKDHAGMPILAPNAGCNQRYDLPNGDILLPVRYQRDPKKRIYVSTVVRCRLDGEILTYIEHGSEHSVLTGRGLYEPSLIKHGDRYFFTLRNDKTAYVTSSADGLYFATIQEWAFDDGKSLESYNTQQHWVTINDGLFLIYTRRGAENDHIMRHRAPLFIAQVDPRKLQVIRNTEQVLIPENHATLGNSGVCTISNDEVWVTCGEGLVSRGNRKGENNRVIIAKVRSAD